MVELLYSNPRINDRATEASVSLLVTWETISVRGVGRGERKQQEIPGTDCY